MVERSPTDCSSGLADWCAACGTPVDLREWHLVALPPAGDLRVFCRQECRATFVPADDPATVPGLPADASDGRGR
ncbi:hypothetical protein ACKVMT_07395 [Halobacteriales archaeon Cl-PHB]